MTAASARRRPGPPHPTGRASSPGLIRVTGDWALAEDATSDAFATALVRWEIDGVPPNPPAWLAITARNRAIDLLRRAATERVEAGRGVPLTDEPDADDDERLRLIFTCCHPALALPAQVALTLRTVAGLDVADIASAFLVSESTMAQRLVRARRKIANAGDPLPGAAARAPRRAAVRRARRDLPDRSTRATRRPPTRRWRRPRSAWPGQVVELMPGDSEARGLLALLLFQHSRRDARRRRRRRAGDARGAGPDALEARRDRDAAVAELRAARGRGPYVLQAAIAECHAVARSRGGDAVGPHRRPLRRAAGVRPRRRSSSSTGRSPSGMRDGPDAGLAAARRPRVPRPRPAAPADRAGRPVGPCRPAGEAARVPRRARRRGSPADGPGCGAGWR